MVVCVVVEPTSIPTVQPRALSDPFSGRPVANAKIISAPGDGVGKEVIAAAHTVLEAAQAKHGFHLDMQHVDCGAQYYQKSGHEWQEGGLEACSDADAVLLGAVGWPGVS